LEVFILNYNEKNEITTINCSYLSKVSHDIKIKQNGKQIPLNNKYTTYTNSYTVSPLSLFLY